MFRIFFWVLGGVRNVSIRVCFGFIIIYMFLIMTEIFMCLCLERFCYVGFIFFSSLVVIGEFRVLLRAVILGLFCGYF